MKCINCKQLLLTDLGDWESCHYHKKYSVCDKDCAIDYLFKEIAKIKKKLK